MDLRLSGRFWIDLPLRIFKTDFVAFRAVVIAVVAAIEQQLGANGIKIHKFGFSAELAVDPDFCLFWVAYLESSFSVFVAPG